MPQNPNFPRIGGNMFENERGVKVEEVDAKTLRKLFPGMPKVDLGAVDNPTEENIETEARVGGLLEKHKELSKKAFQLTWKGSKVPRGAKVGGHEIGWTQNGMVTSTDGQMIGTYERIIDCGGSDGKEQLMVIFLSPEKK